MVIEIIEKILTVIGWLFAFLGFLIAKKNYGKIKKENSQLVEKLEKNQNEQKKEEKELEKMAKFLCDNCGGKTEVSAAKNYSFDGKNFNVCPDCAVKIEKMQKELTELAAKAAEAKAAYDAARATAEQSFLESSENSIDILKKLGLGE